MSEVPHSAALMCQKRSETYKKKMSCVCKTCHAHNARLKLLVDTLSRLHNLWSSLYTAACEVQVRQSLIVYPILHTIKLRCVGGKNNKLL